jgi:hypothetical protein
MESSIQYSRLRDNLKILWIDQIKAEYAKGRITTERSLQAQLYKVIYNICRALDLDIFIEPYFNYPAPEKASYRPDIVICNNKEIMFVGEIKFLPHTFPDIGGDVKKIKLFAQKKGEHNLTIEPSTGYWKKSDEMHRITPATEYGIFVIGRHDSEAVDKSSMDFKEIEGLAERFRLYYGSINPEGETVFGVE